MTRDIFAGDPPPPLRRSVDGQQPAARIGDGHIGGKAAGLMSARQLLADEFDSAKHAEITVDVPRFVVLTTDVFDAFMRSPALQEVVTSGRPDERIAHEFQKHDIPFEYVGDLRMIVEGLRRPIAVRSSSMLEDRLAHPFAGVYETKMIPNNEPDPDARFQKLVEAIKYVYASMFFRGAINYLKTVGKSPADEKMAVLLQEVVGAEHGDRFYPHVSGVGRSYNYYAFGRARPEDGVANLALGLGKMIVDGGVSWAYCPAYPKMPPPFASPRDQMKATQTQFWAVNMGTPPAFDPISETEYLQIHALADADYDGILDFVASSYDGAADRLVPGLRDKWPRVINFAPVLEYDRFPLNDLIVSVMDACERSLGSDVEIEFAITLPTKTQRTAHFGFLQVRPMAGAGDRVEVPDAAPKDWYELIRSDGVLGNGVDEEICDIVYVRPEAFEFKHSKTVAREIELANQALLEAGRMYLLIGFGRWGSSDPWLGIPVQWSQVCAAQTIVEASIEGARVDASQGSHFFHNLSSFGVSYFTVRDGETAVDWLWLDDQETIAETQFVRHVRLKQPLRVVVDGRTSRGVIYRR